MVQPDGGIRDEILVAAAILGDLAAFDELVVRYRAAVVRTAQLFVPPEDAEDVAQEALLLSYKALPSLEEPGRFPAWLHAITRRCAFRYSGRARARRRRIMALDSAILEQVPSVSRPLQDASPDDELRRALDLIPRDYGLALRLHFLDEMPLKRIAGFLGVSLATVKWRIYRGKQLLRAKNGCHSGKGDLWIGTEKSES